MTEKTLMTVQEVADYLQVDKQTVRKWLASKKLKGHKLGDIWRIDPKDLAAFLNERKNTND